jgi:cyclic pyranopterin phosphate synthase
MLIDTFGRAHNSLRISVTDRCNLRCSYCMAEDVVFMDRGQLLTFEEITHFVQVAAPLGINKVRLTGGDAGLRRINISLDTLDPERFRALTRRDGLEQVLAGIDAAQRASFAPIKLNAVIIRGVNDADVVPLARFARDRGLEMRYIEYMPIGAAPWERNKVFFAHEILERIDNAVAPLAPADDYDPHSPAMEMQYTNGSGRVGIIASVSRPFCRHCNRLRLTADGKLRSCLFALTETDIQPFLREQADDLRLAELIQENVRGKWEGHEINTARFIKPLRTMHAIGG